MNDELAARYNAAWTALHALCITADRARESLTALNANPNDPAALERLQAAQAVLMGDAHRALEGIAGFWPVAKGMAGPVQF